MSWRISLAEKIIGGDYFVVTKDQYYGKVVGGFTIKQTEEKVNEQIIYKTAELTKKLQQAKSAIEAQDGNSGALENMMRRQHEMYMLNGLPTINYHAKLGKASQVALTDCIGKLCKSALHECVELEDWTEWKPWSRQLGNKWNGERWSPEHIKQMRMEVIDLLCFVFNLCFLLGMDWKMVWEMYNIKRDINQERHESGRY